MSSEVLKTKTVKQLREIAKGLNISGRWEMTKGKMIEAILEAEKGKITTSEQSAIDEIKIDNQEGVEVESEMKKESASITIDMEQKFRYIENLKIGSLVAFKTSNGKVISAKVDKKSNKRQVLKVVTGYGAEHMVSFADVIWVRTGSRWPRGVYNMLKGLDTTNAEQAVRN